MITIPTEIQELVGKDILIDCYYKNDVSHTFHFMETQEFDLDDARLYIDHDKSEDREDGALHGKYLIMDCGTGEIICDSDSLEDALNAIQKIIDGGE
jgi:hypothetical protein